MTILQLDIGRQRRDKKRSKNHSDGRRAVYSPRWVRRAEGLTAQALKRRVPAPLGLPDVCGLVVAV